MTVNTEPVSPLEKMDIIDRSIANPSANSTAVSIIEWHGDMLEQRAENLKDGTDRFITLEEAEARIRRKTGRES